MGGGYAEEKPVSRTKLVPGLEDDELKAWGKLMKKNKQVVNRVRVPKEIDIEAWAKAVADARPAFEAELAKPSPSNQSEAVKTFKATVSKMAACFRNGNCRDMVINQSKAVYEKNNQ